VTRVAKCDADGRWEFYDFIEMEKTVYGEETGV